MKYLLLLLLLVSIITVNQQHIIATCTGIVSTINKSFNALVTVLKVGKPATITVDSTGCRVFSSTSASKEIAVFSG
ncbi:hypothetical protein [Parasediminibacterium sp. JCM 36343]|uniref:hypothetical protein n=1 Tax=Parasediminibacterium sp. JCM 36343 TaxID=3374279 RepID=UPI00397D2302